MILIKLGLTGKQEMLSAFIFSLFSLCFSYDIVSVLYVIWPWAYK